MAIRSGGRGIPARTGRHGAAGSLPYMLAGAFLLVILSLTVFQVRRTMTGRAEGAKGEPGSSSVAGTRSMTFLEKGTYPTFTSGVMEPGAVRLELSPLGLEDGSFRVRYFAGTHDVDLEQYDLALMTALRYGNRTLKPTHADAMKGHHSTGILVFDIGSIHDPDELTSDLSITVTGLPGNGTRVFRW